MRSHCSSSNLHFFSTLRNYGAPNQSSLSISPTTSCIFFNRRRRTSCFVLQLTESRVRNHVLRHRKFQVKAMDEDISSFDDWGGHERPVEHILSSSEDEDSDGEIVLHSVSDVDLLTSKEKLLSSNDSITLTAHRLAIIGRSRRRKNRIRHGVLNNIGLMTFLTLLVFLVDWCAWRIVRLPLQPFHLMRAFCISAVLVSFAGYICVPIFRSLKIRSIARTAAQSSKKGTPTMGGLFIVPIGVLVAQSLVGFSSVRVSGAAAVTLVFAVIGLVDDCLCLIKNNSNGLSARMRILLEVVAVTCFSFWLDGANMSSPYGMYTF